MPTAELIINDDRFRQELAEDEFGELAGVRRYRVLGTRDASVALAADGLPPRGSPWSGAYPGLLARRKVAEPAGGDAMVVRVEYGTAQSGGGGQPYPTPGLLFSKYAFEVGSELVSLDIAGQPINPDGVSVGTFLGILTVEHHRTSPLPIGTALGLTPVYEPGSANPEWVSRQVVNSAPVSVPRVLGDLTSPEVTFPRGQMRLLTIEQDDQAAPLVYIARFRFAVASDHKHRYRLEDENGRPTGAVQERDVYPFADLRGLWPGG